MTTGDHMLMDAGSMGWWMGFGAVFWIILLIILVVLIVQWLSPNQRARSPVDEEELEELRREVRRLRRELQRLREEKEETDKTD